MENIQNTGMGKSLSGAPHIGENIQPALGYIVGYAGLYLTVLILRISRFGIQYSRGSPVVAELTAHIAPGGCMGQNVICIPAGAEPLFQIFQPEAINRNLFSINLQVYNAQQGFQDTPDIGDSGLIEAQWALVREVFPLLRVKGGEPLQIIEHSIPVQIDLTVSFQRYEQAKQLPQMSTEVITQVVQRSI